MFSKQYKTNKPEAKNNNKNNSLSGCCSCLVSHKGHLTVTGVYTEKP